MSCKINNKSSEALTNELLNQETSYKITPTMTNKDIVEEINRVADKLERTMVDGNRVYSLKSDPKAYFKNSVTRLASKGKKFFEGNEYRADTGTVIHYYVTEYTKLLAKGNKVGIHDLRKSFLDGSYNIGELTFKPEFTVQQIDQMENLGKAFIEEADAYQNSINQLTGKNESWELMTEVPLVNNTKNYAGTPDIFFIFSNKKVKLFDVKSTSSVKTSRDLSRQYNAQLALIKEMFTTQMGLEVITSSLVPIKVAFNIPKGAKVPVNKLNQLTWKTLKNDLAGIKTHFANGKFAKLGIVGIDSWLDNQYTQINILRTKATSKQVSREQREELYKKIEELEKTLDLFIQTSNIDLLTSYMKEFMFPTILEFNAKDVSKMTVEEKDFHMYQLNMAIDELELYKNLIGQFKLFLQLNPDVSESILAIQTKAEEFLDSLESTREKILMDDISEASKMVVTTPEGQEKTVLKPVKKLSFGDSWFSRLHTSDHPILKLFFKKSQEAFNRRNVEENDFSNNFYEIALKAQNFLKANGKKFEEVFLDFEGSPEEGAEDYNKNYGRFKKQMTKEGNSRKYKVLKGTLAELEKVYDIVPTWKEDYIAKRKETFERFVLQEAGDELAAQKKLEVWDKENGFANFNSEKTLADYPGFANTKYSQYYIVKLKKSYIEANYTPEMQFIMSNPELKEFYEVTKKYVKEALNMYGVDGKIPSNFYPQVRASMVENILKNPMAIGNTGKSFMESLAVNDSDFTSMGVDPDGKEIKEVPRLFLGDLKKDALSFDFVSSISLFYKAALQYKASKELEIYSHAMRKLVVETPVEHTTVTGKKVTNFMNDWVKTAGGNTDYEKYYDDMVDYYVYGRTKGFNITTNIMGHEIDVDSAIKKLMQFERTATLGLKIPAAAGAAIASYASKITQGQKGLYFTSAQASSYFSDFYKDRKKFVAARMFFTAHQEDSIERNNFKSKSWVRKAISDDFLLAPFSRPDQELISQVGYAMSKNYGLDENGNIRKLSKLPEGTLSLLDSLEITDNDGVMKFKGKTLDESLIIQQQFFTVVKTAFYRVTGTVNKEDIYRAQMYLGGQMLMMYKSWMPGIIGERFGKIKYDDITDTMEVPRYSAFVTNFMKTDSGQPLKKEMLKLAGRASLLMLDIISPLSMMGGPSFFKSQETEEGGEKITSKRISLTLVKAKFEKWKLENPTEAEKVSLKEFIESQEGQLRAMVAELRIILSFFAVILALGMDDDEDESYYRSNGVMSTANKVLMKARQEALFLYNPAEIFNLAKSPVPIMNTGTKIIMAFVNTLDETRDRVFEENNKADKTDLLHYSGRFIKGFNGLRSFADVIMEGQTD